MHGTTRVVRAYLHGGPMHGKIEVCDRADNIIAVSPPCDADASLVDLDALPPLATLDGIVARPPVYYYSLRSRGYSDRMECDTAIYDYLPRFADNSLTSP